MSPGQRETLTIREQFEAAIWQLAQDHRLTIPNATAFIDDLLNLADAYAAGDSEEVTALRRAVLFRDARPVSSRRLALEHPDRDGRQATRGAATFRPQNEGVAKATNPQAVDIPRHAVDAGDSSLTNRTVTEAPK